MISKALAKKVLNAALSTGADFAEIFLEEKQTSAITVEGEKVENINSGLVFGVGIRILKDLQSVYGYCSDISSKSLLSLAEALSKSFDGKQTIIVDNIKKVRVKNLHNIEKDPTKIAKSEKIRIAKLATKTMEEYDPRIVRTSFSIMDNLQNVTIFNSEGKEFHDQRTRIRFYMSAIAAEGTAIETGAEGPGAQMGFEFVENFDVENAAKEVAKSAITKLSAVECPSGKMPVVIGNGFGGVIFHEACGHSLEASSVSKNLSVFSNKLGQQIASTCVTAIDDGTIPNGWGSSNIDDEGNKTHRTVLIKNGILQNYLVDNFNGRRMNMNGNGASRRESYAFEPTSRMSNTFIAPGPYTPEEIIKATKLGLYAKSLGGGSVNPTTGDFNFAANDAYIIRDGEIAEPVKGATLIGTGADVLMQIDMVGNDLKRAQGVCGASSGNIPVDVGQPTIRVKEITVGGRGGILK